MYDKQLIIGNAIQKTGRYGKDNYLEVDIMVIDIIGTIIYKHT